MSDWKNIEWQKKLKNKPLKYWIRDEIEEIVKEENIDRKRGSVIKSFTDKSEASNYLDELYFPKGEDGDVEALSKEEEEELTI